MNDGFIPSPGCIPDIKELERYFKMNKNQEDQALARQVLNEIQDGFLTTETRDKFIQRCIECACSYAFTEQPTALRNLTLYSMVGIAIALLPKTIQGARA